MSDTIKSLPWKIQRMLLKGDQRILIETAHGLIEVSHDPERRNGLLVKVPPDLRIRKGEKDETVLHGKFLDNEGRPLFTLLSPIQAEVGHELKPVAAIMAK